MLRRTLALLPLLAIAACAPAGPAVDVATGELVVCGDGPTVEGIDVSSWQGAIDWGAVARAGIRYAIVRISDGTYRDRNFATNWEGARAAGLLRGAYQFFEPDVDPDVQADIVIAAVGRLGPGDLPVTIDVEAPSPGISSRDYTARIHRWVDRVTEGTGRAPIVYTGRYYWDPYVASSDFVGLPLWHAQYTSAACPNINDRWSDWAFWQYTSTGSVPGIAGNVDRDRWNGTYEALQGLAGVALCTPHCEGTELVDASCGRGDCAAFGSRCVDDALGVRCAFFACPDTGDTTVCVDDHTLGNCHDGAITTGDCSAFAAYCGTASSVGPVPARCVSAFCVASAADAPVPHDTCLPDGRIAHCNADGGLEDARDCGPGTTCANGPDGAGCADPTPASTPDAGAGDAGVGGGADAGPVDARGAMGRAGVLRGEIRGCSAQPGGAGGGLAWSTLLGLSLILARRARPARRPRPRAPSVALPEDRRPLGAGLGLAARASPVAQRVSRLGPGPRA